MGGLVRVAGHELPLSVALHVVILDGNQQRKRSPLAMAYPPRTSEDRGSWGKTLRDYHSFVAKAKKSHS